MQEQRFIRRPSDAFKTLVSTPRFGLYGTQTRIVLDTAFRHGAWIAGGFAHVIARYVDGPASYEASDIVAGYLQSGTPVQRTHRHWKSVRGDIDLFFETQVNVECFLNDINSSYAMMGAHKAASTSRSCVEIDADNHVPFQAITCQVGPIEEVLSAFDIKNAMVAFNDREIIIPEGWHELSQSSTLHVSNWNSPYVIHRINKWFRKHHYTFLSEQTKAEVPSVALDLMQRLRAAPIKTGWGHLTYESVAMNFVRFLPMLSDEDLLLMFSAYPSDAYGAMQVFINRHAPLTDVVEVARAPA